MPLDAASVPPGFYEDMARKQAEAMRRRPLSPVLKYGPLMAQLADAGTTSAAMKMGGHEANPIMEPMAGNDAALFAAKAGLGVLTGLAANELAKHGHRNLGKVLGVLAIGVPAGLAVHNGIELAKHK